MNLPELQEKLREKRDMIIIVLMIVVVLLLIMLGVNTQKNYGVRKRAEEEAMRPPEKVTLKTPQRSVEGGQRQQQGSASASYFLHPTAEEMMRIIRDSGQAQLPKENQKYTGFRVMWPCYFFQVQKEEGGLAKVVFDVTEDGFGATIISDIDTLLFPEILLTERGKKVWIAGEIIGVDPTGTGTIYIASEEIRFQEGLMDAVKGNGGQAGMAKPLDQ